jgi:hypothetical protein
MQYRLIILIHSTGYSSKGSRPREERVLDRIVQTKGEAGGHVENLCSAGPHRVRCEYQNDESIPHARPPIASLR